MLFWEPLNVPGLSVEQHASILSRLQNELESWVGTRFVRGLEIKGLGVDCDHFACAIFDFLYRRPRTKPLPRARFDAAMNPNGNRELVSFILEMYPNHEPIPDRRLQPGDVALTGPSNGSIGHVVIAGPEPNTFWHAQGRGVRKSGLNVLTAVYDSILGAYRARDKRLWV